MRMNFVIDTHTHTISSGHAYSTLTEMVNAARERGLEAIAITDHGDAIPGGANFIHFSNLRVVPRTINGVEVLRGAEVNIVSLDGDVDLENRVLKELDIVIASFHEPCIAPGTMEENTRCLLKVMENPYIHIIGHPGNPAFPIDIPRVVAKAKEEQVLIEVNDSCIRPTSFRKGSRERCLEIARECQKQGVTIAVGSDAHIHYDVGKFDSARKLVEEAEVDLRLIANTSVEKLKERLRKPL